MRADFYPLQILLFTISGWVNRRQQDMIAYLVEENRVLKEQSKGRKLRLTDDQRRRLAAKAKRLGRQALNRVATIVTPDTLMRWHRQADRAEVDLRGQAGGPSRSHEGHRWAGRADGPGEFELGILPDPR